MMIGTTKSKGNLAWYRTDEAEILAYLSLAKLSKPGTAVLEWHRRFIPVTKPVTYPETNCKIKVYSSTLDTLSSVGSVFRADLHEAIN